jgi:hypothetical protein
MADTTRAITTASGLLGYELETPAKVVVPVITPVVNLLPRRRGVGVDIVHWKAITSFDTARNWDTVADGGTPSSVTYAVAAMQNTIQTLSRYYHYAVRLLLSPTGTHTPPSDWVSLVIGRSWGPPKRRIRCAAW